jgi:hypothetical protein
MIDTADVGPKTSNFLPKQSGIYIYIYNIKIYVWNISFEGKRVLALAPACLCCLMFLLGKSFLHMAGVSGK